MIASTASSEELSVKHEHIDIILLGFEEIEGTRVFLGRVDDEDEILCVNDCGKWSLGNPSVEEAVLAIERELSVRLTACSFAFESFECFGATQWVM